MDLKHDTLSMLKLDTHGVTAIGKRHIDRNRYGLESLSLGARPFGK